MSAALWGEELTTPWRGLTFVPGCWWVISGVILLRAVESLTMWFRLGGGTPERPRTWLGAEALGLPVSVAWRPRSTVCYQSVSPSCLCNGTPRKIKHWGWGELPWLARPWANRHTLMSYNTSHLPGWKLTEALYLEPSWTLPYVSFPLADLYLYLPPVIKHNCGYTNFQWVLWVFLDNTKPDGDFGTPWTYSWCQKWGQSWALCPPPLQLALKLLHAPSQ